ncbi:MAG: hypothetical protein AB1634_10110 [Thermodesulfobacteriota bacterium]
MRSETIRWTVGPGQSRPQIRRAPAAPFADLLPQAAPDSSTPPQASRLLLGRIKPAAPTVSHLIRRLPELRGQLAAIIHAPVNQDKPFHRMLPGTEVWLDRTNGELIWDPAPVAAAEAEAPAAPEAASHEPASLGMISPQHPTVLHLLAEHPGWRQDAWRVIQAPVNQGLPFARLRPGVEVRLDPATLALDWPGARATPEVASSQPPAAAVQEASPPPASDLVRAVSRHLGTPYRRLDCYGLVVRGLEDLGVPYRGKDGLSRQLVAMARRQGLPARGLLNGEGLVAASGGPVFQRTLTVVRDPQAEARDLLAELAPLLEEGMVLSFSTHSRGHTGVVARRDQAWTFINSGELDHPVAPTGLRKGVGEEDLAAELANWCQRAADSRQSLLVTAGRLDPERLRRLAAGEPALTAVRV